MLRSHIVEAVEDGVSDIGLSRIMWPLTGIESAARDQCVGRETARVSIRV